MNFWLWYSISTPIRSIQTKFGDNWSIRSKPPGWGDVPLPTDDGGTTKNLILDFGQWQSIPIWLETIHAKIRENRLIRYKNSSRGRVVPPREEMGKKWISDNRSLFPCIQLKIRIQLKFHWNMMIFSEKHIYKKIVYYTGTLTGGCTRLTPNQNRRFLHADSHAS